MTKAKYLPNYKFNHLTVIEFIGRLDDNNHSFYKCQCDCGKIINIRTQQINIQKSCGCCSYQRKNKIKTRKKYPVGYKFNHLTILKYIDKKDKNRHFFCQCKCDCGNIIDIRLQQINVQKSCGCAKRKKEQRKNR